MGEIKITIDVLNDKANTKMSAKQPSISDLSVALAQLEMMKLSLIGKIAKNTNSIK